MSWEHRASIFLKAATLLSGKYRYKINAATMLGQLPGDIIGKYCDQLVCDKNLHDWAILDHNEQVGTKELLIVRNDSSEIPVLKSIAKIEHGDEEYLIESCVA